MTSPDPLFTPYKLGSLHLRNRLMTSSHEPNYAENGIPGERYIRYHEERARGGIGLTMTAGSAVVSSDSPAAFGNLHLYRDEVVAPLRELVDRCRAQGSAVMIQLTHLGRRTRWDQGDWLTLVSASPIRERSHRAFPKAFEDWDESRIICDYCAAAERVREAGFDGIELEAYGHLLDSFWSPSCDGLEDDGEQKSLAARLRFSKRLIASLRERLGDEFLLGIRMSLDEQASETPAAHTHDEASAAIPGGMLAGFDKQRGLAIARALCKSPTSLHNGVADSAPESSSEDSSEGSHKGSPKGSHKGSLDFLNVICGRIDSDAYLSQVIPSVGMRVAPHLEFVGSIRAELGLPILHAARIASVADARYAIGEGKADIIGMTRAHIADPHIARKTLSGREDDIRPCVGASYCIDRLYLGLDTLCIHNPASGREESMPHDDSLRAHKTNKPRRVLIIGAGPAGLEAARVCLERGHETLLWEASEHAGGQLRLCAQGRRKELIGIVDWRLQQIANLQGNISYNRYAEVEDILAAEPAIVVIASGGVPQKPPLSYGAELAETGWEVLGGAPISSDNDEQLRVMVYDDNGAQAGVQLAETLATRATDSSIYYATPERSVAPDIGGLTHAEVARVFCEHGVRVEISTRLIGVERSGNHLKVELGSDYAPSKRRFLEVDRLFVEHATAANDELYFALKPLSQNLGEVDQRALLEGCEQNICSNSAGKFQLFRIGDAVAARNIHAAVYDALRLCKNF